MINGRGRARKPIRVDIIIPAFNESRIINKTIQDCFRLKELRPRVLVVVDGKTTDDTSTVARKAGAIVIVTKEKRGKGAVFRKGLPYIKSDFVVQIDADHQFQPKEIIKLLEPLLRGYDMTLGTRYERGAKIQTGSVPLLKRFGSYILSFATSIAAKKRITDVMAGFKAFRKESLLKIDPQVDHFGYEAELVIKAAKMNQMIKNVPITYTARITGRSSVSSIKHGLLVLGTILKLGVS